MRSSFVVALLIIGFTCVLGSELQARVADCGHPKPALRTCRYSGFETVPDNYDEQLLAQNDVVILTQKALDALKAFGDTYTREFWSSSTTAQKTFYIPGPPASTPNMGFNCQCTRVT
eukprot:TRINITY_DN9073_c0_g2_i1.p1 TRINITY_DN9073_c0_g2~~TRINITY_DN9073_c0_g2_i1.p1  ORF type:complete len:117 (-),score=14.06 TRINITY_DN9073_c0_g2_i1:612-962(-)